MRDIKMNNWQKVINVSLAVIVTLLIYQNQQLQKELIKVNSSLSGPGLHLDITKETATGLIDLKFEHKAWTKEVFEQLSSLKDNDLTHDLDIKTIKKSLIAHGNDITSLEYDIRRLPKPKSTKNIKDIVNGCSQSWDGNVTHRHKMKC